MSNPGSGNPDVSQPFELSIAAEEAGERLDKLLSRRGLGVSRATLQRWIADGRVHVDGVMARISTKPRVGARVRVEPAPPPSSRAEPQDIALNIVHEDDHLLVIDKPAGLVVHPAPGHPDGTLVNAVLHHTRLAPEDLEPPRSGDVQRPGIVHRLDKDTSGVMVVAKTIAAREGLVAAFQAHHIERLYLAVALGWVPEQMHLDTLHGRHPIDRKRFTTRVVQGKRAITHVELRERLHASALVACRLETGRTHQIRVQLAEHGHPILGDPTYGRRSRDPQLIASSTALGRQALHAAVLGFEHPVSGVWARYETPLPADMLEAIAQLRGPCSEPEA